MTRKQVRGNYRGVYAERGRQRDIDADRERDLELETETRSQTQTKEPVKRATETEIS